MKLLQQIFDEHFLSSDKDELISLFNKYNIFSIIEKSSGQLKIQLQRAISLHSGAPFNAISTTGSNFLVSVNTELTKITDADEKRKLQEAIAQIGLRILLSIIKLFPDDAAEIFEAVKQSLQLTCEMFGYDYSDINGLVKFDELADLTQTLTGKKYADEIKEIPQTEITSITWTNKAPLGYLTTELKRRKWIKSQNEFSRLFGNSDKDLIVHWNMKFKYELAHLLYKLAKDDYIRPRKGFFSVPEKFIVDFSQKKLTRNSLKKINSKITGDHLKYADIIKVVDEIINLLRMQ